MLSSLSCPSLAPHLGTHTLPLKESMIKVSFIFILFTRIERIVPFFLFSSFPPPPPFLLCQHTCSNLSAEDSLCLISARSLELASELIRFLLSHKGRLGLRADVLGELQRGPLLWQTNNANDCISQGIFVCRALSFSTVHLHIFIYLC